jgi:hypothetical protein
MDAKELRKRFSYHPPKDDQPDRYTEIRQFGGSFAGVVVLRTPESREQSIALTKIEEAIFWANAAIARREG